MSSDIIFKVLTLGETSVGKTSIIIRYIENRFHSEQISTIGIDFKNKFVNYQGKKIKLLLCDTAGQERFKNIASQYYRGADGVLLVYDISNRESFEKTKIWIHQLSKKADLLSLVLYLIGNKSDIPNRKITFKEGEKYAKDNNMQFFETSAFNTDNNINVMFEKLIADMYDTNKEKFDESVDDIPVNIRIGKELSEGTKSKNKKCCK